VNVMPREYKRALAEQAKKAAEAARVSDPVVAQAAGAAASPAHG
jgi:hypothetical protein